MENAPPPPPLSPLEDLSSDEDAFAKTGTTPPNGKTKVQGRCEQKWSYYYF